MPATVSHYRIESEIGRGGMGVVYRARDTRLGRPVAIKMLPADAIADTDRRRRFLQEARSASALNHPAIVTIHDIDEHEGTTFIAMELVDGVPLDRVLRAGSLPMEQALDYAAQLAAGLEAAHGAGLVHRDIKPANIMITRDSRAKILDFGLAKLVERAPQEATVSGHTGTGIIVGTAAYMSPEQAQGRLVTARSDIFSLGVVLYEMLAGRRPFDADSEMGLLVAIARDDPPRLRDLHAGIAPDVETIVDRCLAKAPEARYATAGELREAIAAAIASRAAPAAVRSPRRTARIAAASLVVMAVAAAAAWQMVQSSRVRKVRAETIPEIERLVLNGEGMRAVRLANEAERFAPEAVARVRSGWYEFNLDTIPAGADVTMRQYTDLDGDWLPVGRTPIVNYMLPSGYYRLRIVKAGYLPMEASAFALGLRSIKLAPADGAPESMVLVPGAPDHPQRSLPLPDFWMDKYEVTNREFKRFVDAGGYRDPRYWTEPFLDRARTLTFEEAMARFRDATGRPGPSTWELESYPSGKEDYPVGGISWFEAAAYAVFAGKSLPTVHHWFTASGARRELYSDIIRLSNYDGTGPTKPGERAGLAPYGTYDMAGNLKEWVFNQVQGTSMRLILGGAWNEPSYRFADTDAADRWRRDATFGVRLVKNLGPVSERAMAPMPGAPDPRSLVPVSAKELEIYKRVYQYDRTPLNASVDAVDETDEAWRKETITFDAAYRNERIRAYLFLPRTGNPPYQTILLSPSGYGVWAPSSAHLDQAQFEFIVRSGRALLYPVIKGTFERRGDKPTMGPIEFRDITVQQVKDLLRSVDYIATRPELDIQKLAYYSVSMGAGLAPVPLALEPRFKAAVLASGGLRFRWEPEILPANFAPQVKIPVILINGRDDFSAPAPARERFMELLGTPPEHKRLEVLDGGHYPADHRGLIRHTLEWLDTYLGPVR